MTRAVERSVRIAAARVTLVGDLVRPDRASGIVMFAHGSGSSRRSPRNRFVAGLLQDAGFATLLLDLLTPVEDQADAAGARHRFDIDVLSRRLVAATDWIATEPDTAAECRAASSQVEEVPPAPAVTSSPAHAGRTPR